jgi:hypothetical protein
MRVSLVILAALAGHSVAVPCKPKWVISASKSWMSASTRLDKVLAELPTIYADGGTVPPNAIATAAETVVGDDGDLSAASAGVARNRRVSSTPDAAATSSVTPSAGANRNADASDPTSTVTTTTTTITVTPSATGVAAASAAAAEADEASNKADQASAKTENPKDPKMHRRGCPHRQVVSPVTYRTVTEVIPPASTPVVVVYKHVPCTKNNKMHRRSFEGSKEEQKDLDMLSILAESKMGEATNMKELHDKNMEEFEAKQEALKEEKNVLKQQNSQAKILMKEARDWEKKFHKAVREYNLKQQNWEEEMEKNERKRIKQEEKAKKGKKEKRDGPSYDLSEDEKKNEKREPNSLSKEQYEDIIYEKIRERLKKNLAKHSVKEHDRHVYVITKQYKVLKCDKPHGCKGKESSEAQQGVLDSKVKKEDEETKGEETKQEEDCEKEKDAEQEKTKKVKEAEIEEEEVEDEGVKLLADGDEHEQYVRLSTLYMQYRKLLAEGIQKKFDPVLKNDQYAGDEIEGEHEKGDEKEQLRRLTNLYLDFRYMLLPKFTKQLDPILHEGNL